MDDLIAGDLLARIHPGVYRVAGGPVTWESNLVAACLAVNALAVASHRAAAAVWQLDGIEPGWVEISTTRNTSPELHGVRVHRSTDLVESQTTIRRGVRVTNPMRTLVDVAAVVPVWITERALDDGLGRQLVSLEGMWVTIGTLARRGRRGVGVVRRLLEDRGHPPAGFLEAASERLFRRHGIAGFTAEKRCTDDGRFLGRVDFTREELRLIVEVDGFNSHSSPKELQNDHERQNGLIRAGYVLLRFTPGDVFGRPEWMANEIKTMVRILEAQPELGTLTRRIGG